MKKEISPGAVIGIAAVALAIAGGLGFMWFQKATGDAPVSQEQIDRERKATEDRYKGMGVQTSPSTAGTPPTAGTNPEADARSQYPGGSGR
jgi:hypothetical protein